MKKVFFGCLLATLLLLSGAARSQGQSRPLKVVVLAPVYLDSAFQFGEYKPRNGALFPQVSFQGLEFYNGMHMALDSLKKTNISLTVNFYDLRSSEDPFPSILERPELLGSDLIIASLDNVEDQKLLSSFSSLHRIPLISASYPNAIGVEHNSLFFEMNPSIETHMKGLLNFIAAHFPGANILYIRKNGVNEDRLQAWAEQSANVLSHSQSFYLRTLRISVQQKLDFINHYLDSTRMNIVIVGSLDNRLSSNLASALGAVRRRQIILAGLPTLGDMNFSRGNAANLQILSTSAYFWGFRPYNRRLFMNRYRAVHRMAPSERACQAYETVLYFAHLTDRFPRWWNHPMEAFQKEEPVFSQYDLQSVKLEGGKGNYWENKHLYFNLRKAGTLLKVY